MLHKSEDLAPSFFNNRMQTPQNSRITPLFFKKTLEFLGEMIAKPFYLFKKIIFMTNLKQSNLIF
ncbi:hypothetical protein HMPREF1429_00824 [Helicobacter pylori GAM93Bi]|nr:hypothetical protein HMPREF1429_00824 [Helicobacter pylori GAM93Bi]